MNGGRLEVTGCVLHAQSFTVAQLRDLPDPIEDISTRIPGRRGSGVLLQTLLAEVEVSAEARFVTLRSDDLEFSATVPLEATAEAVIVFGDGNRPLPRDQGGPVRFYIPDAARCTTAAVDQCANVKHLGSIELSTDERTDTRPKSSGEHEALHRREQHP